jgi:hypothetical protein
VGFLDPVSRTWIPELGVPSLTALQRDRISGSRFRKMMKEGSARRSEGAWNQAAKACVIKRSSQKREQPPRDGIRPSTGQPHELIGSYSYRHVTLSILSIRLGARLLLFSMSAKVYLKCGWKLQFAGQNSTSLYSCSNRTKEKSAAKFGLHDAACPAPQIGTRQV